MIRKGTNASGGNRDGITESQLREEQLEGRWMDALWLELERQLGKTRHEINGVADVSQNPTRDYARIRAVCYSPSPMVTGMPMEMATAIGDNSGILAIIEYASIGRDIAMGYPEVAARTGISAEAAPMPSDLAWLLGLAQYYWVVCNEVGVYFNHDADTDKMVMQRVRSSDMRGIGNPVDPGSPILLGWNRPVTIGKDRVVSDSWDIWDIRDPKRPTYKIVQGPSWDDDGHYSGGTDITAKVLGTPENPTQVHEGEAYTWRWTKGRRAGRPFIPINIYHANYPERLFDRSTGSELTQGTLTTGVLGSFWLHVCRDCSWPDRNTSGLELAATMVNEDGSPRSIANDPAVIKEWAHIDPERPGQFHQWAPGADPELLGKAIRGYRQMLDEQSVPADISSVGGDPIAHRIEAIRREVERYYPICRKYDSRSLEMIAAILNVATGTDYPESGYGLLYRTEIDDLRKRASEIRERMPAAESSTETNHEDAPNA